MEKNLPLYFFARKCRLAIALGTLFFLSAAVKAQPSLVADIPSASHSFVSANGKLYFAKGDSVLTASTTGVSLVKELGEKIQRIHSVTIGTKVFILTTSGTGQALWVSSGTSASTIRVGAYPAIDPLIAHNADLYLAIDNGSNGRELWKLSSSNTLSLLKDINPGPASGYSTTYGYASSITVSNNQIYFSAVDGGDKDLWKTDGTTAGTVKVVEMPMDRFHSLTDVNGTIFFAADTVDAYYGDAVTELWKTQGTPGTTIRVKSFAPEYPYNTLNSLTSYNGKLYFIRYYGIPSEDLWVSDGTEAGTQYVRQLNIDGYIEKLVPIANYMVYYGASQGFPIGISKVDLITKAASPVRPLNYYYDYSVDFVDLTKAGDMLFFVSHPGSPSDSPGTADAYQLFQSTPNYDGATTKSLKELYGFPYNNTKNITNATGNDVFFTTNNSSGEMKLWFYDPDNSACGNSRGLTREVWTNISGNNVTSIPVNTPPTRVEEVTSFSGPVNEADRYGARYRGYLCVPTTGSYKFYIASDDYSELYLSTTASPANKTRIAYVHGATKRGEYTKYPSQQSTMIALVAGTQYYIEALHKEGGTYDHITVAMQYPNGTMENPILGSHLIPFNSNKAPTVTITSPTDGQEFSPSDRITITADASDADGTVVKVEFYVTGGGYNNHQLASDDTAPYTAWWGDCCPEGTFTITANAFDDDGAVTSTSITIQRVPCSATGQILREVWTNVKGQQVSLIPVKDAPSSSGFLTSLEGPANAGDYYGARISGYICVPWDGEYTFYISSDDHSELWLSTDADPANKQKIAYVYGATKRREFTKYPSQTSVKIYLRQNKKYYIEVLHKENLGYDHFTVGWTLPNGLPEIPIAGSRLSPYERNSAAREAILADASESEFKKGTTGFSLTPNPVKGGKVSLSTEGFNLSQDSKMTVEVVSMTGEVVYTKQFLCESDCQSVELDFSGQVRPGLYVVKGNANGKAFVERMIVE